MLVRAVAIGHHFAFANEHDLIARDLDLAENMRIQKHRGPSFALRANDITHPPPQRIESPESRLVQKNQVGLMNERLREADALQHALGEILEPLVGMA